MILSAIATKRGRAHGGGPLLAVMRLVRQLGPGRSQAALQAELAVAEALAPRLMPNLAELYREKVAMLHGTLAGEDAAAAREQVRALIDEVRIIPSPADPKAVPRPSLAGVLQAAGLVERHALKTTKAPDALASGASIFWLRGLATTE